MCLLSFIGMKIKEASSKNLDVHTRIGFTLEQTMKSQRGSRILALLFH
jgi:hypothetical protein